MGLIRTSPPTSLITPSGAKAHLRIDHAEDDALLTEMLAASTDYIERQTNTALGAADYLMTLDGWPASGSFRVPRPPLLSIDSITYRDGDGQAVPLPSGSFAVDETERPARVVLIGNLPATPVAPGAVRVSFRAGYETPEDAPAALLHAVKMVLGHFYENREAAIDRRVDTVPMAVESICWQHTMPEAV